MIQNLLVWFIQFSPFTKKWFWKKWYTFFPRLAPSPEFKFMNFGFHEDGLHPDLGENDKMERYPIHLYHHVATQVDLAGKTVLEVGSGRGGGASYIARYLAPDQITGIDISTTAVELCDRLYKENNLNFIVGDSENIPSQDESMDVVINVESSHCYGSVDLFLSEVKRVLRPGGHFLFCDLRPAEKLDLLNNQFNISGLELLEKKDITGNVILALEKMSDFRKKAIREKVPRIIQEVFESYAGVKGSKTYESFSDGSLAYLSAVFQKPA